MQREREMWRLMGMKKWSFSDFASVGLVSVFVFWHGASAFVGIEV